MDAPHIREITREENMVARLLETDVKKKVKKCMDPTEKRENATNTAHSFLDDPNVFDAAAVFRSRAGTRKNENATLEEFDLLYYEDFLECILAVVIGSVGHVALSQTRLIREIAGLVHSENSSMDTSILTTFTLDTWTHLMCQAVTFACNELSARKLNVPPVSSFTVKVGNREANSSAPGDAAQSIVFHVYTSKSKSCATTHDALVCALFSLVGPGVNHKGSRVSIQWRIVGVMIVTWILIADIYKSHTRTALQWPRILNDTPASVGQKRMRTKASDMWNLMMEGVVKVVHDSQLSGYLWEGQETTPTDITQTAKRMSQEMVAYMNKTDGFVELVYNIDGYVCNYVNTRTSGEDVYV